MPNEYVQIRRGPSVMVKVILAVVLLVVLVIGGFVAYKTFFSGDDSSSPLVAGESFQPGESQTIYETETTAKLDGTDQLVEATDPTAEWKEAFPDATCKDKICTAPAPASVPGDSSGFSIPGIPAGMGIGGVVAVLLLGAFVLIILSED